jgi:uncharacterized protein (DUF433 family)
VSEYIRMAQLVSERRDQPWRRRLYLPIYQVGEAARYANISPQTVAAWHRADSRIALTLSEKDAGDALSYLQLIEVAVVAAFREWGLPLHRIRATREYVRTEFKTEFPFAAYKFKTDGKSMLMDYQQIEGKRGKGKLLDTSTAKGQLAWDDIVGARLKEFDYERGRGAKALAIRWRVNGNSSPVVIDPQVAFGTPTVSGTPTWVVRERWDAGESIDDIAYDFRLNKTDVARALEFEGVTPDVARQRTWVH